LSVKVDGLDDFRRELRQGDPALGKALRGVHKEIGDSVRDGARRRSRKQHVRRALTSRGSQRSAEIALLKSRAEDVFGEEFGAKAYRQFPSWRGNQWSDPKSLTVGYMVHPEIASQSEAINRGYLDAVDKAMRGAFPD
jgi:hypothetical protein